MNRSQNHEESPIPTGWIKRIGEAFSYPGEAALYRYDRFQPSYSYFFILEDSVAVAADDVIDGEDNEDKEIPRDDDFFDEAINKGEQEFRSVLLPGKTQAVPVSSTNRQEKRKSSFILAIEQCRFVSFSEILCD